MLTLFSSSESNLRIARDLATIPRDDANLLRMDHLYVKPAAQAADVGMPRLQCAFSHPDKAQITDRCEPQGGKLCFPVPTTGISSVKVKQNPIEPDREVHVRGGKP